MYAELEKILPRDSFSFDEPLQKHTTFRIGGPADVLAAPREDTQLLALLAYIRSAGLRSVIIGNGSNILFPDRGFRGIVIKLGAEFSGITLHEEADETVTLHARAGTLLRRLANTACEAGLGGLEFAAGIPGSVGGAVFMNAGAYGGEMSQIIVSCRALMPDGALREFSKEELKLGYRTSVFSQNGGIVTSCRIKLQAGDRETIYGYMRELAGRRTEKQPLNLPSAGSTFKRPEGYFAGKLIQDSGCRGLRVGGARISQKHAGCVVNETDASAEDVIRLIRLVQMRVRDCFGVDLEPEVRIIGEN